ncbi:dihydrolipoyl dehydrogenase [Granulosicoccus sp.]|nr:dihydrolipoyl dehydrogenase [Granulosicoccus sp.]
MSTTREVDVAIIGTGTAGMGAYREAVKQTDNVLLIEGNAYGTTCASVGCMPSKMLIAAAHAAHAGKHAEGFGIHYEAPRIDGKAVMARLQSLRDRYVDSVEESVLEWPSRHRIMAKARFEGSNELALEPIDGSESQKVKASQIVIATGSSPVMPDTFSKAGNNVITSDAVFDWDDLPESVLVFGAGVIGLELGQALHRLGVRVVLLGKNNSIAQLSDPEVSTAALSIIGDEMDFHSDHELETLEKTDSGVHAIWSSDTGGGDDVFEKVIVAIGRAPNLPDLCLDKTNIELTERGVPVFDPATGRCGDSHIYIAGDANAHVPLLHTASRQGKTGGSNAGRHPDTHASAEYAGLSVTFCDPQIATAGQSFKALTDAGIEFASGEIDWSNQGRSTVMLVNKGISRIYGDMATGRLLGAEMIGPAAEHMAHLLTWEIESGAEVTDLLSRPFYHPCIEEGLRTALRKLAHRMGRTNEEPVPRCLDCGPGS